MRSQRTSPRPPQLPGLSDEHWSRWRKYIEPRPGAIRDNVEFASELVNLRVFPKRLEVHGTYYFVNPTSASVALTIGFPVAVAADRPAPRSLSVDGKDVAMVLDSPRRASASFVISIPVLSVRSFEIRYTQPHTGRRTEYIVTSALSWKKPITRAVFRIVADGGLGRVRTSYPGRIVRDEKGRSVITIARQPFVPDREMTMTW